MSSGDDDFDGLTSPPEKLEKVEPSLSPTRPPLPPIIASIPNQLQPSRTVLRSRIITGATGSLGDVVLIESMGGGNHPAVAWKARDNPLPMPPGSEDVSMKDLDAMAHEDQLKLDEERRRQAQVSAAQAVAQEALTVMVAPPIPHKRGERKDSTITTIPEVQSTSNRSPPAESLNGLCINNVACQPQSLPRSSPPTQTPRTPLSEPRRSPWPTDEMVMSSPMTARITQTIPEGEVLPRLHSNTMSSPIRPPTSSHHTRLPSIANIISTVDRQRHDIRRRGQSMSSIHAPSPSVYSASPWSARSPATFSATSSHTSPTFSHHSPTASGLPLSFATFASLRRGSQASEISPSTYGPPISTSTLNSQVPGTTPPSFTPQSATSTAPPPHFFEVDSSLARPEEKPVKIEPQPIVVGDGSVERKSMEKFPSFSSPPLPPGQHPLPTGNLEAHDIGHVPPHGSGSFKCSFQGCGAAPFQTQYLLNSHATVHSTQRPHYCPIPNCARSFGGKGFKRKNEMIRHGLVHESPGYICPFCPDREHKYPRPDNLQRHVKAHHSDRDREDPRLKDVLGQRGGFGPAATFNPLVVAGAAGIGRGRRRRVSSGM